MLFAAESTQKNSVDVLRSEGGFGKSIDSTRMYQHIVALCTFSVFGNSHGWLIPDNVRLANSFVHLSADWPSDYATLLNMHSATLR